MRLSTLPKMFVAGLILLAFLPTFVAAQTAEIPFHNEPYAWDSGLHDGQSTALVGARHTVASADAPWLKIYFGDTNLGRNSSVVMTSLHDGASQSLNAKTLAEWQNGSAYFNGDKVEVSLQVGPGDQGIFVKIEEIRVGEWVGGVPTPLSQCGPTDDRVPSNNLATGRLLSVGCTGWIVDNGLHVTAGHCSGGGAQTLQFNVPPSLPNGTIQNPGPEDQYSVDPASKVFVNGGIGNDWGVFSVFDNSVTGQQPIVAQGASFTIDQDLGPPNIRITGFGVDTGTANQTQQTHVGPNAGSSVTTMRYVTDTEPGNSGSPVIDDATGEAVGVHTHGGCSVGGGGNNNGTSTFNAAFFAALNPGPSDVTVTVSPIGAPIVIPLGGGSYSYDVSVSVTGSSQTFDLWNLITIPNSNTFTTVGPVTVTLAPGNYGPFTLTQNIPAVAPPGSYNQAFNVGTFPGTITSSDDFDFTKSSTAPLAKLSPSWHGNDWWVVDAATGRQFDWNALAESAHAQEVALPDGITLEQNYPNPFNPSTVIRYALNQGTFVQLKVYNMLGQEIITLVDELQDAGEKSVTWNGTDDSGQIVSAGIYLYQVQAGDLVKVNKMVFVK